MGCNCNNRLVFAFGTAITLAGAMTAVIYAATFIPPYVYARNHEAVQCRVLSGMKNGNYCCDATWRGSMALCTDVIPCYQIVVMYTAPGGSTNITAHLYYNYQSIGYQNPNYNCSHYLCPSTYAETTIDGTAFLASKGIAGQRYTCYRNPKNPLEVLPSVIPVLNIILATILPALASILGSIVCCVGYKGHFTHCQVEWDDEQEVIVDKQNICKKKDKNEGLARGDLAKGSLNGNITNCEENKPDDADDGGEDG